MSQLCKFLEFTKGSLRVMTLEEEIGSSWLEIVKYTEEWGGYGQLLVSSHIFELGSLVRGVLRVARRVSALPQPSMHLLLACFRIVHSVDDSYSSILDEAS